MQPKKKPSYLQLDSGPVKVIPNAPLTNRSMDVDLVQRKLDAFAKCIENDNRSKRKRSNSR